MQVIYVACEREHYEKHLISAFYDLSVTSSMFFAQKQNLIECVELLHETVQGTFKIKMRKITIINKAFPFGSPVSAWLISENKGKSSFLYL